MKREIITTKDGSTSLFIPEWNETYHSKNGAIQEAYHVFIKNGLSIFKGKSVSILEIGFGTGLNAFITSLEAEKNNLPIDYTAVEAFPITIEEIDAMNFASKIDSNKTNIFIAIHQLNWEVKNQVCDNFYLTKRKQFFQDINDKEYFDIIYFDAFSFDVQPELWSEAIFTKMHTALKTNGILVTYACRTIIKQAMISAGFSIEKLPGAPGKREMLRAYK
ncbi:MAG: tRNA (5-methylaminomethyl-2-thiouridine)(34)-methyltransferase MnmD [Flavobacterium sp.]|uniref:tRNA (5-methylaminomethyl-2-thiouridine)(34)-methyltransferase MnmD n=1 Tax=Flavobacterium macrobrachii TaxID=591204 RepID=A0ABS2CYC5_9FLAO|nr:MULTISPECIES: tRNA (5-methylaminomethyl-2-thiouridine)(34)-methyltransferase MnmD [Flavobacterium]MBM6499967.1 tRNA (5-methylaminomethyl-2-thiouridine)(34)-methyltransferase MnmD [Flavobacterium macrobrachii]MCZ8332156.1 tRNA (5-methylaminomethyl-2-thiouridine)(34)-methyltransferase MnmD [Flavobacterium sp.]